MEVFTIKKSFVLFITLFLLSIFSFILIFIYQTKSIQTKNIQNQYLYIQANNHKNFLIQYLKSINLEGKENIKIKDDIFNIEAKIQKLEEKNIFEIHIFIKAKKHPIRLYEKVNLK